MFFILVYLLVVIRTALGQTQDHSLKFEHISVEQGLSQSVVISILQDHQGFMWFGTQDGLDKYDGYTFTIYKHDDSDSTSLSSNNITALYEDNENTLWIGTGGGGLNCFNRDTGRFLHYVTDPLNPNSLSNDYVNAVHEDKSGVLWIATGGGGLCRLDRKDRKHGRFIHFLHDSNNPKSLSNDIVSTICEDRSGRLWIGTHGGLNRFNRETGLFTHFVLQGENSDGSGSDQVLAICKDPLSDSILWIGTNNRGLYRFNMTTGRSSHFTSNPTDPRSISNDNVVAICADPDSQGTLWIGTWGGGLNQFDSRAGTFTRFIHDPKNPRSFGHNIACTIVADRAGTLWIGTWGDGINKISNRHRRFTHFDNDPANPNSLSDNHVNAICEDHAGRLWVGTDYGLNRLDPDMVRNKQFVEDHRDPYSLSGDHILAIYEDHSQTLWIGTKNGLNRYDQNSGHFKRFIHHPNDIYSLGRNSVYSILEDHTGMLWVATGKGLDRFNRKTGKFNHFLHNPADPHSLSENLVFIVYEDHLGELWIGTSRGLNLFNRHTEKFNRFLHDAKNPNSLSHDLVSYIYEDHGGTLWIGTANGLNRFDRQGGQFVRYTEKNGLPDDMIYGILEDNKGRLWLSTNNGISRFDPAINMFRNYDVIDGLQSKEFNFGAYYKSKSDQMFFGGINGLNAFYPNDITDNSYVPPVVITDLRILDKPVRFNRALENLKMIRLSYNQNFLSFEFAALNYTGTPKNQYAYKMDGVDPAWIYSGTRRYINYTDLDPGEYVLHIKGSNNDGIWNEAGTTLKIIITPPWWKTWWAYMFYALGILGLLYNVRRYEMGRIHLRNRFRLEHVEAEKLKELDQMKSRFFANISHEFRTPLTLVLGQINMTMSKMTEGKTKEKLAVAMRNARRMLDLVNQLLDLSKLESGTMKLNLVRNNVVPFIKMTVNSFEAMANEKKIALNFECPDREIVLDYEPDNLEKIITNLLSNAFKFTPQGGTIYVRLSVLNEQLADKEQAVRSSIQISIKDTGIGIATDRLAHIFDRFYRVDDADTRPFEGTGIGLALAKELAELHHGHISVTSEPDKGSEFVVQLPLRQEMAGDLTHDTLRKTGMQEKTFASVTKHPVPIIKDVNGSDEPDAATGRGLILIVEDNPDVRAFIHDNLESTYNVHEAVDGEQGLLVAKDVIPDLIISDVMMPKMDGYEFSQKIRSDEKTSHIPIIMLTAKAADEDKISGLQSGVDAYLVKPFNARELLIRIGNLISMRRNLRKRFSTATVIRPSEVSAVSADQVFLRRTLETIELHMAEETFNVEALVQEINMSESQLSRKLNALIGQPPGQLIRSMRLQRAADLLRKGAGNVAEVCYQVGFSDQANFTRSFKKQFGMAPKTFRQRR